MFFVFFQSKLHMEGFRSLKEGEAVEFTFKKSSKGLESQRVTGPGGIHCVGSERRPKGKKHQKRRSKGDRWAWHTEHLHRSWNTQSSSSSSSFFGGALVKVAFTATCLVCVSEVNKKKKKTSKYWENPPDVTDKTFIPRWENSVILSVTAKKKPLKGFVWFWLWFILFGLFVNRER